MHYVCMLEHEKFALYFWKLRVAQMHGTYMKLQLPKLCAN